MAEQPRWAVAGVFYLVYALGLMLFVVIPYQTCKSVFKVASMWALLGFLRTPHTI